MDAGALADEIADILGFQVGLKWKIIPTGTKEQFKDDQTSRALIIEVPTLTKYTCQRQLLSFYSREKKA